MNMKRILITLSVVMLTVIPMLAESLSKVTVDNRQYYVYEVKKGDTMFGLARQFGWNQQVFRQCNPNQLSTLKKGTYVYYPCDPDSTDNNEIQTESVERGQITHKIERGETLYSIARMYGVTVTKLKSLNPGAGDDIKAGDVILISEAKMDSGDSSSYHMIKPGETLYGVAKANKVSIAAILQANPGISENNFRSGKTIKIPSAGTGVTIEKKMVTENVMGGFKPYKVKKNETWETIARDNNISVETLMDANKGIELKKNKYIGIPVLTQRTVEREFISEDQRPVDEIYADVHGIQDSVAYPVVNYAVVAVEPNTRRDREILRGVLMAVNTLKNSGIKINLKMVDGSAASESCVKELDSFNPTVVFSTAESQTPIWLTQFAAERHVPLVNALDVKNDAYQTNPYVVQLITPSDYFNDEIAAWFKERYEGYSLVFTGEEDGNDQLAESLKKIWNPAMVRSRSVDDLKTKPFNRTGKYVLYSYPTRKQDVSEFLDAVTASAENSPGVQVAVIGRPNWIVYDEALSEKFHKANVRIPARFYMNKTARQNSDFALSYRQMFDGDVPNTFPVYSGIGYDCALYFIEGLGENGGDLNSLGDSRGTVQNDFTLERPSTWTGPINREVYIIQFTPYGSVEKTAVK